MNIKTTVIRGCIAAVLLCIVSVFLVVYGFRILICRGFWPNIESPSIFVRDCRNLINSLSADELRYQENKKRLSGGVVPPLWPISIRELKPRSVHVHEDYVNITISTGGVNPAGGYIVFNRESEILKSLSNRNNRINGKHILNSKYKDIYRWEGIE